MHLKVAFRIGNDSGAPKKRRNLKIKTTECIMAGDLGVDVNAL